MAGEDRGLVCWCAGVLVCWRAGVLVCWCAGVLVCWCAGVPVCWCAGVLVCWCAGVLVLMAMRRRCVLVDQEQEVEDTNTDEVCSGFGEGTLCFERLFTLIKTSLYF